MSVAATAPLEAFLELAPDAMVAVDDHGLIVAVNGEALRVLGYERERLLGSPIECLVPEPQRDAHARHRAAFVQETRARAMGSQLELLAQRSDGSQLPVEISLRPFEASSGRIVVAAIRDVSARRATQRALELAYQELESFSDAAAHDLRAPLRGISGFAEILAREHARALDDDGRDCLAEIRDNAARMTALIDALLSLSRASRAELRRDHVEIGALARQLLRRYAREDPSRTVDVTVDADLQAWVDPSLVRPLLDNLLRNAWKFTAHVCPARIEFGETTSAGGRCFFVRDNGVGFDPARAARLFTPFVRLHPEHEFAGTGIGLATARRIVRRHGGELWATSQPGEGATFCFTLPDEGAA
ncbi:MAG: PAS domain S-box protein [Nannocystaceae bacterium]|nr:PAS domain S-box protein [Nannocystaceae bacterium]